MKGARGFNPCVRKLKFPMLHSTVKKKKILIRILSYNKDFCHLQSMTAEFKNILKIVWQDMAKNTGC